MTRYGFAVIFIAHGVAKDRRRIGESRPVQGSAKRMRRTKLWLQGYDGDDKEKARSENTAWDLNAKGPQGRRRSADRPAEQEVERCVAGPHDRRR